MQKVNYFFQFISKTPSNSKSLIFLYRYFSLGLTSIFYLIGPQSPLIFKIVVVVSVCIAAWIITDLQQKYLNSRMVLKSVVLTEMIGLTLLLIPTGGITSPFIWYALNPVLVAAAFLTPIFCWSSLLFYLGSATTIAYYVFQFDSIGMILERNYYFYLVCVLIILLARLFTELTKSLDAKASLLNEQQRQLLIVNKSLTETNKKYEQTLEHIMSLYHLMDSFASKKESKGLEEEITTSLIKCTQSDEAFFWLSDLNHQNSYLTNKTTIDQLEMKLKSLWKSIRGRRESFKEKVDGEWYLMKIIRTSHNIGILGVKVSDLNDFDNPFLLNRPFEFLVDLSEIMLEKVYLDKILDQMLIIEEQNRIANEIHDSVSQRLFGIVYALHSLQHRGPKMTKTELNKEYQFLSEAANTTIKELRSTIYRLSSVKKGEKPFLISLKKYLDEFSKLNDVSVEYEITGDERFISEQLKRSLYRIIFEACGNAVRHGHCNVIQLQLSILEEKLIIVIKDDGIGIKSEVNHKNKEQGIGLINMQKLVSSYSGTFSIDGSDGTEIKIEIPKRNMEQNEEVVI